MMALSVIIIPNILGYIGELLYLRAPTRFYKQLLNRPNIVQMIAPITNPGYCELDFLVSKTGLIQKIMIFVNKIDNVVKIAAYLYMLLPIENED